MNSSNELRLIAQDEQIKQLGQLQPRKSINAVHFNIRREYAKMQSEADELRTVLPHNMETIKELCRRSGVYWLLPHQLCKLFYSAITVIPYLDPAMLII